MAATIRSVDQLASGLEQLRRTVDQRASDQEQMTRDITKLAAEQNVICGRQLDTMRWERWTKWQRGDPRWRVHVLDSTNLTIDQVVDQIVAWVRAKQHRGAHSEYQSAAR